MRTSVLAVAVLAAAIVLAMGTEPGARGGPARPAGPGAPGLLPPGELARQAAALGAGPRSIAGVPVGQVARVDMAGATGSGRTVLVIGCLEGARCAGAGLVADALAGCPPAKLDLWTVRGIRGGATGPGWRAVRRLVSDARPDTVILFRRRPPAPGGGLGAVAGWVTRVLPSTRVVEVSLATRPQGRRRAGHLARLRAAIGLDAKGRGA